MSQKLLKFSVSQIILEGYSKVGLDDFSKIQPEEIDPLLFKKGTPDEETLSINITEKATLSDRFITLYFLNGDKYPYSEKVVDKNLNEQDNPRSPDQIELDDQFFVLIDTKTQRIYISDLRRKPLIKEWLHDRLQVEVTIKAIIDESEFLNKIKNINKISFTIVPNLFNSTSNSLSQRLVEDIYGFGAEKARLELDFGNSRLTDQIASKINAILGRKAEYQEITVIGRSDSEMESILNLEGITNTITVDVSLDPKSKLLNVGEVFASLINKIAE